MSKLVKSLREAIIESGLKSGMTVSFHHHMRNGDYSIYPFSIGKMPKRTR